MTEVDWLAVDGYEPHTTLEGQSRVLTASCRTTCVDETQQIQTALALHANAEQKTYSEPDDLLTSEVEAVSGLQLFPLFDGGGRLAVQSQTDLQTSGVQTHRVPQSVINSVTYRQTDFTSDFTGKLFSCLQHKVIVLYFKGIVGHFG